MVDRKAWTSIEMDFTLPEIHSGDLNQILSPSLVVFVERLESNIDRMIEMAGSVDRLRPHCKTHKMAAVVELLVARGITHHKAATFAEVEMLVNAGASDVVLAYNPVGPNIARVVQCAQKWPQLSFSVTADHAAPLKLLADACAEASVTVGVMLDLNVGQNRTGVTPQSDAAFSLYSAIAQASHLRPAGFHVYDGHQHQEDLTERSAAVRHEWPSVTEFRDRCVDARLPVPELLCGGTPTFPVYAQMNDTAIRLSPGTSIFHDVGYGSHFPDLPFHPAAAVVTRIISCPTENRVTLDLGNKAVAADPPNGARVYFPDLPDGKQMIHNEEHLVLETSRAGQFTPGDVLLGIPAHICPTSALHDQVTVIENGRVSNRWNVTARNRRITV